MPSLSIASLFGSKKVLPVTKQAVKPSNVSFIVLRFKKYFKKLIKKEM